MHCTCLTQEATCNPLDVTDDGWRLHAGRQGLVDERVVGGTGQLDIVGPSLQEAADKPHQKGGESTLSEVTRVHIEDQILQKILEFNPLSVGKG